MPADRLNLADALLGAAVREGRGGNPAVREPTRAWSYAELAEEVARVAAALLDQGVRRGDRVAVLMPDGLDAVASILGAIHAGAVAVPISELSRPNDVRAILRDAGAVLAIVHATLEPILEEVRKDMPSIRTVVCVGGAGHVHDTSYEALVGHAPQVPPADTDGDEPALILYSGVPSDEPRGVPHSHRAPLAAADIYARGILALGPRDRVFSLAKLASSYGIGAGLFFPLAVGAEAVLLPDQPKTPVVFGMMEALPPTVLFATPTIYGQFLQDTSSEQNPERRFASVRACVSGAEQLPRGLAERLRDRLQVDVLAGYGLNEAFHFIFSNRRGDSRDGASGKVLDGFEARLVSEDGGPVPPNEIGTLEVRGPTVAKGYWNRDVPDTFHGDWLHTQDRFLVDADGFWFHAGRTDDLFKVGGKWVSPAEVEQTLLHHEAVWECAVVDIEDENGLTKPLAYVVPNVGHTGGIALEKELIAYVKREIAPYKYPRWIEFIDALPKGPQGKVLRYKLPRKRPKRQRDPTMG